MKQEELTELVMTGKNNEALTTSKIVANEFGKSHKHVIESIENILNSRDKPSDSNKAENWALQNMFIKDSYKAKGSLRNYPIYYMTRDGFSLLAMGFTGKKALQFKLKFIEAFNKMEEYIKNENKPSYMLEDKVERAKKWVEEQEYTLGLEATVKEQEPDVQFAKAVGNAKSLISVGDMANILSKNGIDTGRTRLYQWLRDNHLVQQKRRKPTQYSINTGVLKVQETHSIDSYGHDHVNIVSRVTTKGQKYILQKFGVVGGEINLLNEGVK